MIRRLWADRLFRSTSWFVGATLVAGFANYGLQVILGRFLSNQQYGLFNALLGVSVILGVPVATLMNLTSRKTAELSAGAKKEFVASLFSWLNKKIFFLSFSGLILFSIFSDPLTQFLNAPSRWPVLILGLCIMSALWAPIPMGVLQGLQEHAWFAFLQAFTGPSRLIFCGIAAVLALGVNGVLVGLFLSQVVVWWVSYALVVKRVGHTENGNQVKISAWSEGFPVLVANFSFALITQIDLILVNRLFSPQEASLYASAAILGRSIVYLPGALVLAMFPMVAETRIKKLNTKPILFKSLGMTIFVSGTGALLFYFGSEIILRIFFGQKYVASAGILKYFGLSMLPMALLTILTQYLVARGNTAFGYVVFIGAVIEVFLIHIFHSNLLSVVSIVGLVGIILFSLGLLFSLMEKNELSSEPLNLIMTRGA